MPKFSAMVLCMTILAWTVDARATVYNVGPGQPHEELTTVPWLDLAAGDQVRIHWRSRPYRTKFGLSSRGTADRRILIKGVPGPAGQRPEITGADAVTAEQNRGFFNPRWDEFLGVVVIKRGSNQPWGYKPGYITIEGLKITGGHPDNGYTDQDGGSGRYQAGSGGIWAIVAEHLIVRNCEITDNGNGLFVLSKSDEAEVSRKVLVQNNHIHNNGIVGSYYEHNVYTQVADITFEGNRIGRLRSGAEGSSLKDRSSSTVIRYNWIEPMALAIDLVDPEDSGSILIHEPGFNNTYVYGNVIYHDAIQAARRGDVVATRMIHFGGDSGQTDIYRRRLHFFNNTVVIRSNLADAWRMHIFRLSTNNQSVYVSNNVLHRMGDSNFALMTQFGTAYLRGRNWVSAGWWPGDERYFEGAIRVQQAPLTGSDPGLSNIEQRDLEPRPNSALIDSVGALPGELAPHPVRRAYEPLFGTMTRRTLGAGMDVGALEARSVDDGGLPRVAVRDLVVDESAGRVQARVVLSKPASTPIALRVHTRTATAVPRHDYYGFTRRIEFAPGVTEVAVPIDIVDDADNEGDESFMLRLFGVDPTEALLARYGGAITIRDDD